NRAWRGGGAGQRVRRGGRGASQGVLRPAPGADGTGDAAVAGRPAGADFLGVARRARLILAIRCRRAPRGALCWGKRPRLGRVGRWTVRTAAPRWASGRRFARAAAPRS